MGKFKVSFGADPEFFVRELETSGKKFKVVPSCERFGGTKGASLFLSPDGGFLEDGATVEFNVVPCATLEEVAQKIHGLVLVFKEKFKGYDIHHASHAQFDMAELRKFPQAMQVGCAADLWVYGLRTAPQINKFKDKRFAGGHVHVGIDPWPEGLVKENLVKVLDVLMLFPAARKLFVDHHRYPFYGHPGLYRDTSYGIEYRSPDNWWCNSHYSPEDRSEGIGRVDYCFKLISAVLEAHGHGAALNDFIREYFHRVNLDYHIQENLATPAGLKYYTSYTQGLTDKLEAFAAAPDKNPMDETRKPKRKYSFLDDLMDEAL